MARPRHRIAVLMGGESPERDVSLRSGLAVSKALQSRGHHVLEVDISEEKDVRALDGEWLDAIFIALHGGFGEDGRLQRRLEQLALPYTGSGPAACARAMDKVQAKSIFASAGLPTPQFRILPEGAFEELARSQADALGYPVFVKPRAEGSSFGVSRHSGPETLYAGVEHAQQFGRTVLLEKEVPGTEVTVGIVGEHVLPPIEIRPGGAFFDTGAKYEDPATGYAVGPAFPAWTLSRLTSTARAAHDALGCRGFSRVDLVVSETGTPYVLEVNTVPGLTERSLLPKAARAAGMEFAGLCETLVQDAIARSAFPRVSAA